MYTFLYEDAANLRLFETLYSKYYQDLMVVAYSILKNSVLAEDVVQDTFLNIASHMENLKELVQDKQKKYMISMVRNKAIDYLRASRKEIIKDFEDDAEYNELSSDIDILEELCSREQEDILLQELDKMSEKYHMVLEYHYFRELTREEIADLMEVDVGLVDVWLHRARMRFAEVLGLEQNEKKKRRRKNKV